MAIPTPTFMGLPLELRNRIYEFVFANEDHSIIFAVSVFKSRKWVGLNPLYLVSRQVHTEARGPYDLTPQFTNKFYHVFRPPLAHRIPSLVRLSVTEIRLFGRDCTPRRSPVRTIVSKVNFPNLKKVVVKTSRKPGLCMDLDPTSPECAQILHYNLDPESLFDEVEEAKHDRRIVNQAKARVDAYDIQPFTSKTDHAFKLYYEAFVVIHRNPSFYWEQTADMVSSVLHLH